MKKESRLFPRKRHSPSIYVCTGEGGAYKEYNEKEKKRGVMVNIRVSVDEHISLRMEATEKGESVTKIIRDKLFGEGQ